MNHFAEEMVNLFCCCCCGVVQTDPMFFHGLVFCAATILLLMLQSWRGNHSCNKANRRVQSAEGGRQLLLQQNQKLQSAEKRERHPYCSRSRGSICGGRARQIFLPQHTKRFNLHSEGNNCCCSKIKWFNLQRETDRHTS
jgi:hypothetical protein